MYEPEYYCGADIQVGIQLNKDAPIPLSAPYFNVSQVTSKEAIFGHNTVVPGAFADGESLTQGTIAIVLGEEPEWFNDYPYTVLFNLYVQPLPIYGKAKILIINHVHIQSQQVQVTADGGPTSTIYNFIGVIGNSVVDDSFIAIPVPEVVRTPVEPEVEVEVEPEAVVPAIIEIVPDPVPVGMNTHISLWQILDNDTEDPHPVTVSYLQLKTLATDFAEAGVDFRNDSGTGNWYRQEDNRYTATKHKEIVVNLPMLENVIGPPNLGHLRAEAISMFMEQYTTPLADIDQPGVCWLMFIEAAGGVYYDLIGFVDYINIGAPADLTELLHHFRAILYGHAPND